MKTQIEKMIAEEARNYENYTQDDDNQILDNVEARLEGEDLEMFFKTRKEIESGNIVILNLL